MSKRQDPREFFSQHHEAYVQSPRHARGPDLDLLIEGLQPKAGQSALDVATGAGHTAVRLAEHGLQVTVADITREMLNDAMALAQNRGLALAALEAPAESLPLADQIMDFVTCRRAAHHFQDVDAFLRESHRVLKPGGRLGISDMTGSSAHIDWLNELERLRDPSHHRALPPDEWYRKLVDTGFEDITIRLSEEPMPAEEWLSPVAVDSPSGASALHFMRQPMAPAEFLRGDRFIKRRILLWAVRP